MFSVQFKLLVTIRIFQKGQGVNQSPIKTTIYTSFKLDVISAIESPSIRQWEVHGEEALELGTHFFLQTFQQF